MSFHYPDDLQYRETHEWLSPGGRVGVTDFAQDELGDVVFVELPDPADPLTAGEPFGVIESIKAVSDLYAPADGEVVAVNDALVDRPELVNEAPYDEGWLIEVRVDAPGDLLSAGAYRERVV